ncbi:hypothetical protein BKA66DRAFT_424302 [Pyrenochaeta sp. MPI-SDFR-AT-0127]|nr:hypothetical protein BKA66DRAFT_424302 [Pyrenochaeta sp. MPI-SDFR-AT-0127]
MLVHIPHPLVVARCTPSVSAEKEDMIIPYLQDDGIKEGRLLSVSTLIHTYIERGVSNETMLDSLPPIWLPSPELNSSSVIGVFTDPPSYCRDNLSYPISVMYAEEHRNTTSTCLPLLTCSVSAFWEVSRHETVIVGGKPMAQTSEFVDAGFSKVSYQNPIALDLARIPLFNDANFTRSLQITPYGLCLAAMMVTALAEVPSRFALSTIPTNTTILPIYKFTWVKHGYGYNLSPTSVRLSFSIIAMYCTVAIAYLLYVLFTGTTSSAWNSPIELVLLALRSRRPDNLDHVSVGAECLKTYQKAVGIRVNSKEELELVFADTRDVGANELHKIVRNQSY